MGFSKDWTDEERLKIVCLLANVIQSDIAAGRYGAPVGPQIDDGVPIEFRPNMQSIIEVIAQPGSILEQGRESIEGMVRETLAEMGESEDEFYDTSLAEQRELISMLHEISATGCDRPAVVMGGELEQADCPWCLLKDVETITKDQADALCLNSDKDTWCLQHQLVYLTVRKGTGLMSEALVREVVRAYARATTPMTAPTGDLMKIGASVIKTDGGFFAVLHDSEIDAITAAVSGMGQVHGPFESIEMAKETGSKILTQMISEFDKSGITARRFAGKS